jgi:hypothetical protein
VQFLRNGRDHWITFQNEVCTFNAYTTYDQMLLLCYVRVIVVHSLLEAEQRTIYAALSKWLSVLQHILLLDAVAAELHNSSCSLHS